MNELSSQIGTKKKGKGQNWSGIDGEKRKIRENRSKNIGNKTRNRRRKAGQKDGNGGRFSKNVSAVHNLATFFVALPQKGGGKGSLLIIY